MLRVSKADVIRVSSSSEQKWRSNTRNVSFWKSSRWLIYNISQIDKTKLCEYESDLPSNEPWEVTQCSTGLMMFYNNVNPPRREGGQNSFFF